MAVLLPLLCLLIRHHRLSLHLPRLLDLRRCRPNLLWTRPSRSVLLLLKLALKRSTRGPVLRHQRDRARPLHLRLFHCILFLLVLHSSRESRRPTRREEREIDTRLWRRSTVLFEQTQPPPLRLPRPSSSRLRLHQVSTPMRQLLLAQQPRTKAAHLLAKPKSCNSASRVATSAKARHCGMKRRWRH